VKTYGAALLLLTTIGACSDGSVGDQTPADASHSILGPGMRLRDVQNPANKESGQTVDITGVVTTAIDTFDETHDGKSLGTIFVQDADISGPLAGISMYAPTFIPANLRLAPGDVIQMDGQYNEQMMIGSTVDFAPDFLPQMYKPQVQPMFEMPTPTPTVITLADLADFTHARPYLGMLVELDDITVPYAPLNDGTGRVHAALTTDTGAPSLATELYDLNPSSFAANTHFDKIIGLVDFFFTIYICPRSAADLVTGDDAGP
jgi:hypothetical protein